MPYTLLFIMLCTLAADVFAQCGISISADRQQICVPGTVVLKARGCTTCTGYEWNAGSAWVAAGDSFSVLVGTPGQYDVKVRFRTPGGGTCTAVANNVFTGRSKPVPSIATSSPLQCHETDSILIRDITPHSATRDWLLDGHVIRRGDAAVKYRFQAPWGYKPVFLTVRDSFGCVGSKFIDSAVGAFRPVKMNLNANRFRGCIPGNISYTLIADTFEQGIRSLQWVFPGASSAKALEGREVAPVQYNKAGRYGVQLVLRTDVGCSYSHAFDDVVSLGDSIRLRLDRAPTHACMGTAVRFTISGSRTGKTAWNWSPELVAMHPSGAGAMDVLFNDTGYFSLTLREDSLGCSAMTSFRNLVKVEGPLAGMKILTPEYCNIPDTLKIDNASREAAGAVTSYEWTLFDEQMRQVETRNTRELVWYPRRLHSWHVRLIAKASNGCADTLMRTEAVLGKPLEIRVSETPNPACPGQLQLLRPADTGNTGRREMFFEWTLWNRQQDTLRRSTGKYLEWSSADTGRFSYRVTVWNRKGCRDTLEKTDTLKIYYPEIVISPSDSFVCRNQNFQLRSGIRMPSATAQRFWEGRNLDSGNRVRFGAPDSALISLSRQGRYRFDFFYTDKAGGGCSFRIPLPNRIYVSGPNVSARLTPAADCLPVKSLHIATIHSDVDLAGESLKPGFQWKEKYRQRSVLDSQALRTTATLFRESQIYTFVYSGRSGCSDSSAPLHVQGGVQARFEIRSKGQCRNDTFIMYNLSSPLASHFRWTCSDTSLTFLPAPTSRQPFVIARKAGVFWVKLVVTSQNRCFDTMVNAFRVDSVRADFYSPDTVTYCAPQMAELYNRSYNSRFNQWSFDADTAAISTSLNRTNTVKLLRRNAPGGVGVKLVVRTWNGCSDSLLRPDYLKTIGPVASFSINGNVGCEPLRTHFVNQSSYYRKAIIDYGDGTVGDSTGSSSHVYRVQDKTAGYQVYYPAFALYDSLGCYAYEKSKEPVVVMKAPEARFETDMRTGCAPLKVRFLNRTLFYLQMSWDFDGDGIFEQADANPVYTFHLPGKYKPRLMATNEFNCPDTFILPCEIEALQGPAADFSMSTDSSCFNDTVYFYDRSTASSRIVKYSWNLGDETRFDDTGSGIVARWVYCMPYDKQIGLTVTDSTGCSATRLRNLHIHDTIPPVHHGLSHVTVMDDNRSIGVYWNRYRHNDFLSYRVYQDSTRYIYLKSCRNAFDTMYLTRRGDSVNSRNYCFTLRTEDTCNITNAYGISHCTIVAKAEKQDGMPYTLRLKWTPYTGWLNLQHYEVYRAEAGAAFRRWRIMKPWELEMYDSFLCNKEYCYYVVAVNAFGTRSRSNETCGVPLYLSPAKAVPVELATVEDSRQVLLRWEPVSWLPAGSSYAIYRYDGRSNRQVGISKDPVFTDATARINEQPYMYRLQCIDHCGVRGKTGNHASTIFLSGTCAGRDAKLRWTPYSHWSAGVAAYAVQLRGNDGQFITRSVLPDTATEWTDYQAITQEVDTLVYRILAMEDSAVADTSVSNFAFVIPPSHVVVPTAFTPNGDGINDRFSAHAVFVVKHTQVPRKAFMMEIYNRWGQMVFRSADPDEAWDGTYMGRDCPEGVYAFLVKGVGYDGQWHVEEGMFSLLR